MLKTICALLVAIALIGCSRAPTSKYKRLTDANIHRLTEGTSYSDVERLLGPPDKDGETLPGSDQHGYIWEETWEDGKGKQTKEHGRTLTIYCERSDSRRLKRMDLFKWSGYKNSGARIPDSNS
jgi:hypothetical protein